jgi:hypothetical protein
MTQELVYWTAFQHTINALATLEPRLQGCEAVMAACLLSTDQDPYISVEENDILLDKISQEILEGTVCTQPGVCLTLKKRHPERDVVVTVTFRAKEDRYVFFLEEES